MSSSPTTFLRDTIVAIATPAGEGAIGVVRVSGAGAREVVAPLLGAAGRALDGQPSHTVRRVALVDPLGGGPIDTALCTVMLAPRSYTGEDVVELSCHGSPAVLRAVTERAVMHGARLAEPGEFTRRAYLNGRIDLAQAEAVALLIGARTERAAALAARSVAGALSEPLRAVRETLLDVVAGLEVTLDFPEEGVGLGVDDAAERLAAVRMEVDRQLAAARHGRVVHDGLTVALVGAANAGKSSLFNALLGGERAIVSPVAGTTRDVVDATVALAGVPVRLLDTAGLGLARDPIEAEGMRRTTLAMDESDLLLVVLDCATVPNRRVLEQTAGRRRVVILSKADLPMNPACTDVDDAIAVSCVTGSGLDTVVKRLTEEVHARAAMEADEGGIVASLRQIELLAALSRALASGETAVLAAPLEAALVDLRDALGAVCSLLGTDVGDAVLDRVFSSFCLGK